MEHLRSFKASVESFQSTSIEITGGDDRQGAAVARAFCKKLKFINLSDISYYDIIQPKYSHINCTVLFKFGFCVCVCSRFFVLLALGGRCLAGVFSTSIYRNDTWAAMIIGRQAPGLST